MLDSIQNMTNGRQDYLSVVFRNLGFAFFAPIGSIIFQWLVFKKDIFIGYFYFSAFAFLLGCAFIAIGCIILAETKK